MTPSTANALHAAETWLQRLRVDPTAIAVVTVKPEASAGVWARGMNKVAALRRCGMDDAAVELCEAVAPAVLEALAQQGEDAKVAIMEKVATGAKLQALLDPAAGEMTVRIVVQGQAITIASLVRADPDH